MADKPSHIADDGSAKMVDVSAKPVSRRWATAEATIALRSETVSKIEANQVAKGNVLATARIAGIPAVKRTDELIPLCHSLPVQHAQIEVENRPEGIRIEARGTTTPPTGVETEALPRASTRSLTIYDI